MTEYRASFDATIRFNVEIFAEPPIIAAYDQGVHLPNVKVGFQRLKGQKRTEMIH
jgi:hypothetical protein